METLAGVDLPSLERYAQLIVQKGCNVQPGQVFQIGADAQNVDFAVLVAEAAYEAGGSFCEFRFVGRSDAEVSNSFIS